MRVLNLLFFAAVLAFTGCAHSGKAAPSAANETVNPYTVFDKALNAIGKGDVDAIMALREEPNQTQMAEFVRTLYKRYGRVERIHSVAFYREAGVSRGVFLAAHTNGPFMWDLIHDGANYTMVRGTNEFQPYLLPTAPPDDALKLATEAVGALNRGDAMAVYANLICNCTSASQFKQQVTDLVSRATKETGLQFIRAESVPGLANQMQLLHFLSKRESMNLGYHFVLWNVGGVWKINAVNWTQEELIPPPGKTVSQN